MTDTDVRPFGPQFVLPPHSEASAPPERRGLARDGVRLLVASPQGISHAVFRDLPDQLEAGDLLVVNTSATLPAAVDAVRAGGGPALVHVSAGLDDGSWVIEVRRPGNDGPVGDVRVGERLSLPGGITLEVATSYPEAGLSQSRLWRSEPDPLTARIRYLLDHGRPIRYSYLSGAWPLEDLQNVYADQIGSAEMPSAGRPITSSLLVRLLSRGVVIAPVVLHTGVSSPEKSEPPSAERFEVPVPTAQQVNLARASGRRVVAVGTTVVRALETAATADGEVAAADGWTDLVLGPDRPARVVDGLITGLHEPQASHLLLLQAVAGAEVVERAYATVAQGGYLWHEFGDSMLFLP